MKYIVTGKEMRQIDRNTTSLFKVPEVVLMEQAAFAFSKKLISEHEQGKVLIICGCGNNGADGIAVARLLNLNGYFATVFYVVKYII